MWKYLFAIVVSTAVIMTSVYLYRHQDEMFRPDVRKRGGTRIVFAIEGGTPNEDYLTAMRRRFDPRGRIGVVVRKGDGAEVEILVPHGAAHAGTVARIERVAGQPGKFAFVPTASLTVDEGVAKYVQTTYVGSKSTPRNTPPSRPINTLGGHEFPLSIVGAAPSRYRWVRLGETALTALKLDPASLTGSNLAEKSTVERAAKTGALLLPTAQPEAMMLVARLPLESAPAFFLLVRDETDAHALASRQIRRAVSENDGRGPSMIRLLLEPDGVQRLAAIQQQQETIRLSPRVSRMSVHIRLLALILDDQVAALPHFSLDNRSEALMEGGAGDEERDDLVCLLREVPRGVRLSQKPIRVEPLEPGN